MQPQSAVDAEMQKVFASEGFELEAVSKIISPHPSKTLGTGASNHFYLFVDLKSEDADRAIAALDGKVMPWGGTLTVSKARGEGSRKVIKEQYGKYNGFKREDPGTKSERW